MKKWFENNLELLIVLLGFSLFWLINVAVVYLVLIGVIAFVLLNKGMNRVKFIYFDVMIFVLYIILTIIDITIVKNDTLHVLVTILGLWYISSFYFKKS